MAKKTKGEKPAADDKKGGRRKERSTKSGSEPANPSAGKSEKAADPTGPLSTTTGVGADGTNAGEETAASPGQTQKTQATTTATSTALSGEASSQAKHSGRAEPELTGHRPTRDAPPVRPPRIVKQMRSTAGTTSPLPPARPSRLHRHPRPRANPVRRPPHQAANDGSPLMRQVLAAVRLAPSPLSGQSRRTDQQKENLPFHPSHLRPPKRSGERRQ
ncbi:hypothetical protein V5799_015490 [Amblyomma americanum]|uniref:Uncharacterized protein n=1 Tax=Amblyomma americanum TaxID=6943 RepID=A0AAQ4F7P5_AMBAM